jgi:hypothetical protein
MSYSYVKTVFPNFNYSNVYDTKLYDNVNNSNITTKLNFEPRDNIQDDVYYISNGKQNEKIVLPETRIETFQNNQKFYNIPYIPSPPQASLPKDDINIEHFEKEIIQTKQDNHNDYTKHVLECSSCKELLIKQFNIESDRIRNEEIMELISFIIFGIFILLLLDKSK